MEDSNGEAAGTPTSMQQALLEARKALAAAQMDAAARLATRALRYGALFWPFAAIGDRPAAPPADRA